VKAYDTYELAADIAELIRERGAERAFLAGHDWGAAVAWEVAMHHPDVVEKLAIVNLPHPRTMQNAVRSNPKQMLRSWYIFFFQIPWLPERLLRARRFYGFRRGFEQDARPGGFSAEDIDRYVEAWSQPGAIEAMLNYYRATIRQLPKSVAARVKTVQAPTRVIFGDNDRYIRSELAEPDRADVPNLERVIHLPNASHWVQHDEPERVSELLSEFFTRA
jgi:epoxide hydrolase 4